MDELSMPVDETGDSAVAVARNDLAHVRELILASHTDIVPDLIQGESVTELVASIDRAKSAFASVIEAQPQPVHIPAGGNTPITIDIDALPTSEKIRRGLAQAQRS